MQTMLGRQLYVYWNPLEKAEMSIHTWLIPEEAEAIVDGFEGRQPESSHSSFLSATEKGRRTMPFLPIDLTQWLRGYSIRKGSQHLNWLYRFRWPSTLAFELRPHIVIRERTKMLRLDSWKLPLSYTSRRRNYSTKVQCPNQVGSFQPEEWHDKHLKRSASKISPDTLETGSAVHGKAILYIVFEHY